MKRPARIFRTVLKIPDKDAAKKKPNHIECIKLIGICAVWSCNRVDIDPHHLMNPEGQPRQGMRADDRYTIPICRYHHTSGPQSIHPKGSPDYEAYIMKMWGIPGRELADGLFSLTGDVEAMERLVFKMRDYARLKMAGVA